MIHGYSLDMGGKVYLGFVKNAPIFEQVAQKAIDELGISPSLLEGKSFSTFLVRELVQHTDGEIVGYSVVRKGMAQGFLWYPHEKEYAENEAAQFTKQFNTPYECIALQEDFSESEK